MRPMSTDRDLAQLSRPDEALLQSEARRAYLLSLSDTLQSLDDPTEIQREATRL